jgi:hypothetical protein
VRDFPDIHSASSATAERHERVCGRSDSAPRRRTAPRRTSGCDHCGQAPRRLGASPSLAGPVSPPKVSGSTGCCSGLTPRAGDAGRFATKGRCAP